MQKAVIFMEEARYARHRENITADMCEAVLQIHCDSGAPLEEINDLRPSLEATIRHWWDSHNTCYDGQTRWGNFLLWWIWVSPYARVRCWIDGTPYADRAELGKTIIGEPRQEGTQQ